MTCIKIKHNPYKIVKYFEEEVAEYTGAPYAVSVDSCTNAIFLCCVYEKVAGKTVYIPAKTYLSVPMSVIHAGGKVKFVDKDWAGIYKLEPFNIYDSAKRLTSSMYIAKSHMCISFHIKKSLSIGKGGMILTDNPEAVDWFKVARYEGRSEKNYVDDDITMLGWNMYMEPSQAVKGIQLLSTIDQRTQKDLDANKQGYPDLSKYKVYQTYDK